MPPSAEPYNTLCRRTIAASSVYTSINAAAYILAFLIIYFSAKQENVANKVVNM